MHFDTFYQFFIYSKNWAYIMMFITLPLFVVFWNTILYPTQDKEVVPSSTKSKASSASASAGALKRKPTRLSLKA